MRRAVVVHAEARRDLIEARAYYDERREGFGPLVVDAIEREFNEESPPPIHTHCTRSL